MKQPPKPGVKSTGFRHNYEKTIRLSLHLHALRLSIKKRSTWAAL